MKICENCGMEYGDDSSFCPYCDERYGVVIAENDVISADFPAYAEEFPPIGETCVKEKSFAANRDEIFRRNMLLSVIGENIPAQNETYELHKPVKVTKKINNNGEIILYAKRNTVAEIFNKIKQSPIFKHFNFGNIVCMLAFAAILLFTGKSWYDKLNAPDPFINPPFPEVSENTAEEPHTLTVPNKITVTNDSGLELKLTYKDKQAEWAYGYNFEFTNTYDHDIDRFCDEFTGAEYSDKFYALWVIDTEELEVKAIEYWDDGIPQSSRSYTVKPGETVSGYMVLNFSDTEDYKPTLEFVHTVF